MRSVILGAVAGVISGLFGVGGGVIVVPGLVLWMELDQRRAAATSLATITMSAAMAVVLFGRASAIDWPAAGYLLIGAAVGVRLAARYLDRVPTTWLTWTFVALMLLAAMRLAFP